MSHPFTTALRQLPQRLPRRLPRRLPPLSLTLTTVGLLLVLPSLGLLRWPRPRAEGLEQLMSSASLLQSFPATPERPLPDLWRLRIGGAQAATLWRQQRRTWWQFWGEHSDSGAYLALPATGTLAPAATGRLPANALRVGNLVVFAQDPLARQLLSDRLRPRQRRSRGVQLRCLERLQTQQAVMWNPTALGVIVGPIAPMLQRFQEGCLSLSLDAGAVTWDGETAASDGVLGPAPAALSSGSQGMAPLPADLLLEVEGGSLDQLIQGLLAREMIRDPLASRYGLDAQRIAQLRRTPFRLRLRPQGQGAFQASLELQLRVGRDARSWEPALERLGRSLKEQGLKPAPASTAQAWIREDGVTVGGWRWITAADGERQLVLFLGPDPKLVLPLGREGRPLSAGVLRLRARPDALQSLGLLPTQTPPIVQRAAQLWLAAEAGRTPVDPALSRLEGRLQVRR